MPQFAQDAALSQGYQGSDTTQQAHEPEFGRICKQVCELATAVFDLPLAILKIYEGGELDIKATAGFTSEHLLDDLSFCQRKLIPGESLLIPDATADARYFLEAAVLNAPKLRFYVDIPLVSDGVVLGVLALSERTPRHDFNAHKLNLLRQFANSAATTIALARAAAEGKMAFELKSQQQRFDLAQEMTGIGYWSVDLKTREVTWSKGLYAVYGLSPKTYKPRVATQLDIYDQADQALIIDKFQRAVNAGEDFDFNVDILRRKDKATRTIRTRGGVEMGDDGKPARLYAVVRDISEGVSDQEELIKARMAAEDVTTAKTDFLNHITTELKTPLNNILAYARLLNEQRFDNPDVASYTLNLLKSAKALQSLVKDTLDVTSLDAAPRETDHAHSREDAVNVSTLIREVVDQFATQAQANQTRLTAQFIDFDNPYARIDAMRVRQVLQNLIGNACKFTRGGLISVTASQITAENTLGKAPQTLLRISVRDSGIGMSEAQSLALFNGSDVTDNRTNGAGLGLKISKAIIDLLGGHIGVVSRLGEGANFWFEIPVQWSEAPARVIEAAPYAASIATPAPRPLRAPVETVRSQIAAPAVNRAAPVDDERINREYLRALLEDMKLDMQ